MNVSPRIALVEDDEDLRLTTEEFLCEAGCSVWSAGSAEEFYQRFVAKPVDLVILDIGLPGDDGLKVASLLRDNPLVDVIILSARDATEDRLAGFRAGADRYLVKPINLQELLANIEAVAKHRQLSPWASAPQAPGGEPSASPGGVNTAAGWMLNPQEWSILAPSRLPLGLTAREFKLLNLLIEARGDVVTKKDLCNELFGPRILTAGDRLNVLVARLRKKALATLGEELPVKTVHQLGYAFSAPCVIARP